MRIRADIWIPLLVIVMLWVSTCLHYYIKAYSDPLNYLNFARDFVGNFTSSKWPAVYPAFLAIMLQIVGKYFIFIINLLPLSLLIAGTAVLAKIVSDEGRGRMGAALCALLLLQCDPALWIYLVNPYRDPMAMMFLVGSVACLSGYLVHPGKAVRMLLPAGLLLGLSCSTREPNILVILPMILCAFIFWRSDRRIRFFPCAISFAAGMALGIAPLLLQSYAASGNILIPPQAAAQQNLLPGIHLNTREPVLTKAALYFFENAGWPWLIGLAIGLVEGIRNRNRLVLFMLCPSIVVFFGFYGFYEYFVTRYYFIVLVLATPLSAYGWSRLLASLKFFPRRAPRIYAEALILIGLTLFTAFGLFRIGKNTGFRISGARELVQAIEDLLPADSQILCPRNLSEIISWFSHPSSRSVSKIHRGDVESDERLSRFISGILSQGMPVYLFDAKGGTMLSKESELVRRFFDLQPMAELDPERFQLGKVWPSRSIHIYSVVERSQHEVSALLESVGADKNFLRFNAGFTSPGDLPPERHLEINGSVIDIPIRNGANYINLGRLDLNSPYAITLRSSSVVPSEIQAVLLSSQSPVLLELGAWDTPSNLAYLSDEFHLNRHQNKHLRGIEKQGRITVPLAATDPSRRWFVEFIAASWYFQPERPLMISASHKGTHLGDFTLTQNEELSHHVIALPPGLPDHASIDVDLTIQADGTDAEGVSRPDVFCLHRAWVYSHDRSGVEGWDIGSENDTPALSSGFHAREEDSSGVDYRWSAKEAVLKLYDLPTEGAELTLTMSTKYRPKAPAPANPVFLFNGNPLAVSSRATVNANGFQQVRLKVPKKWILPETNELRIHCTEWIPKETEGRGDGRSLGLMLDRVDWKPLFQETSDSGH
ncbi:MAG: hypothetical protein O2901_03475 [Verrucomicrobia bacterium]|nr:hypothetical protein [Verrucomicrobiota bacterium]